MHIPQLLISLVLYSTSLAMDYCDKCKYGDHVMCVRRTCRPSGYCDQIEQKALTGTEQSYLLHIHNKMRDNLAKGIVPKQPNGGDIRKIDWDDELATIAQCWVNTCRLEHDECRDTDRFKVGQNIGMVVSTDKIYVAMMVAMEDIFKQWFSKHIHFSSGEVRIYKGTSPEYAQLAYAHMTHVGCAKVMYVNRSTGMYAMHLLCNYGGRPNMNSELYKIGPPCSTCHFHQLACDRSYDGLCSAATSRRTSLVLFVQMSLISGVLFKMVFQ